MNFVAEWPNKKKTWLENKQLKQARRKDRRHFEDKSSRPARPGNNRRMSVEQLKKVTRCGNCKQKGHWHEECPHPYNAKDVPSSSDQGSSKPRNHLTAFTYFGPDSSGSGGNLASFLCFHETVPIAGQNYLTLPAGHAIVDPGAAQDLIGEPSYRRLVDKLKTSGLRPVVLESKPESASGIGGQATPLFEALVPCFLGNQPGIVKLTVLQEDIPQLLSIGLLEHAKSVIDTADNTIYFKAFDCGATMDRLTSGHRVLDVATWKGGKFEVPQQVLEQFDLASDAFELSDSTSDRAYIGSCGRGDGDRGFFGEISQFRDCLENIFQGVEPKSEVFYRKGLQHVFLGRSTCLGKPENLEERFRWRSSFAVFEDRFVKLEHSVFVPGLQHSISVSTDSIPLISLYTDIYELAYLHTLPDIVPRDVNSQHMKHDRTPLTCMTESRDVSHFQADETVEQHEKTAARASLDPTTAVCSNLSGQPSPETVSQHHEALSKRDGDRSAAGDVVQSSEATAAPTSEGVQLGIASGREDATSNHCRRESSKCSGGGGSGISRELSSSRGTSSQRRQSVWALGEVQLVQEEDQVRGLQQFQSSYEVVEGSFLGDTCATAQVGPSSEELSRRRIDQCRSTAGIGETESSFGGGNHTSIDSSGPGSSSPQPVDAQHDVKLGTSNFSLKPTSNYSGRSSN